MESEEFKSKVFIFLRQNLLIVFLVVAGLICLGYGLIALTGSTNSDDEIIIGSSETTNSASKIIADIEGGVIKPGVYELSASSRIQDLVIAAGGLSGDADREWVSKNINLAAKITDGAKVYIPKTGEKQGNNSSQAGLININSATASELDSLPGIGLVTAEKIIQNRPYQTLDELVSKKAVTSSVFGNIKDKISLY